MIEKLMKLVHLCENAALDQIQELDEVRSENEDAVLGRKPGHVEIWDASLIDLGVGCKSLLSDIMN